MTTATNNTVAPELIAHIQAENAATMARVEANPGSWAMTVTDDAAHWASYGIFTVEQYERHMAIEGFISFYKDCHGIKPRWMNFDAMSLEEINAGIDDLAAYAESMQDEWAAEEAYMAKKEAEWAEEGRIRDAEATGDFSAVNDEHRDEYVTEQAPLGSLDLLFG